MGVAPFKQDPLQLVYVQVADHLHARIEARELPPGSKLPPERELAAEYGVAYNTVRRAMDVLRDRGLVMTLRGHGNYVTRVRELRQAMVSRNLPLEKSGRSQARTGKWRSTIVHIGQRSLSGIWPLNCAYAV
jgi:GntR family transcriptional regulator